MKSQILLGTLLALALSTAALAQSHDECVACVEGDGSYCADSAVCHPGKSEECGDKELLFTTPEQCKGFVWPDQLEHGVPPPPPPPLGIKSKVVTPEEVEPPHAPPEDKYITALRLAAAGVPATGYELEYGAGAQVLQRGGQLGDGEPFARTAQKIGPGANIHLLEFQVDLGNTLEVVSGPLPITDDLKYQLDFQKALTAYHDALIGVMEGCWPEVKKDVALRQEAAELLVQQNDLADKRLKKKQLLQRAQAREAGFFEKLSKYLEVKKQKKAVTAAEKEKAVVDKKLEVIEGQLAELAKTLDPKYPLVRYSIIKREGDKGPSQMESRTVTMKALLDAYHARLPDELASYQLTAMKKGLFVRCLPANTSNNLQVNYGLTLASFGSARANGFDLMFHPQDGLQKALFVNARAAVTAFLAGEKELKDVLADPELRAVFTYAAWKTAVDAYADATDQRSYHRKNVYEQMPKTSTEDMIRGIAAVKSRTALAAWAKAVKAGDFAAVLGRMKTAFCASADNCALFHGLAKMGPSIANVPRAMATIFKGEDGTVEGHAKMRPMFDHRATEFPGETDDAYGLGSRKNKVNGEAYAVLADKSYPLFKIGDHFGFVVEARTGGSTTDKVKDRSTFTYPLKPSDGTASGKGKIEPSLKMVSAANR